MRIYKDCLELITEAMRDIWEMGHEVHTDTMQNKVVKGDVNFLTKEVINYSYNLLSLQNEDKLFMADPKMLEYCKVELDARISPRWENPGQSWMVRPDVWTQFLNREKMFDYSYNERIRKQLQQVVRELTVRPDTRQAIISIWDPNIDVQNLGGIKRVPCSIYYQFLIRDGKLEIIYNMRSCDVVTHFGVDVWLAFKLMEKVAEWVGVKPGSLHHNITSFHCYQKDWPKLKSLLENASK